MAAPDSPDEIPLAVRASRYFALLTLAVSGPLLVIAGDRPDYFTAYQCDGLDLVAIAAVACLGPPLGLTALEALTGRHGPRVHLVLLGLLFFGIDAQFMAWGLQVHGAGRLLGALLLTALWMRYARAFPRTPGQAVPLYLSALLPAAHLLFLSPTAAMLRQPAPPVLRAKVGNKVPVVILVFDAFPLSTLLGPDHLVDAARHPHFAALAGDATFYRNASANHPLTNHSIPTIHSGRYPEEGRLPLAAHHPDNLFSLLGDSYRMRLVDPYTLLVPGNLPDATRYQRTRANRYASIAEDAGKILPFFARESLSEQALGEQVQKFSVFHREAEDPARHEGIDDRASFLRRMLADLGPEDREALIYAHVVLPHAPWVHTPEGPIYRMPDAAKGIRLKFLSASQVLFYWTRDAFVVHQAYQRHLLQAMFADRLLGEAVARLKELGIYDDALVIVTADHGASFAPRSFPRDLVLPDSPMVKQGVGEPNVHEIVPVPLFVKLPGRREGRVDDRNVELVDLLPTLADVLALELPWKVDGVSLLAPPEVKPARKLFTGFGFERIELPPELPARFDPIATRRAWFAGATPGEKAWVYRPGPHGALVGQPLPASRIGEPGSRRLELDPAGAQPPGVRTGRLAGGPEPAHLALVHGGQVLAVTRSLVPEEPGPQPWIAFHPAGAGGEPLEVYEVRGDPGVATFHRLSP